MITAVLTVSPSLVKRRWVWWGAGWLASPLMTALGKLHGTAYHRCTLYIEKRVDRAR